MFSFSLTEEHLTFLVIFLIFIPFLLATYIATVILERRQASHDPSKVVLASSQNSEQDTSNSLESPKTGQPASSASTKIKRKKNYNKSKKK